MSKSSVSAGLAALGNVLGSTVAKKTVKKKRTTPAKTAKKKGRRSGLSQTFTSQRFGVSAPVNRGFIARSGSGHTLAIPFESVQISLIQYALNSADLVQLYDGARMSSYQGNGTVGTILHPNVGASGPSPVWLQCLPGVLTNIVSNFAKYRFSSLRIGWVPTGASPTSTSGSIAFTLVSDPNTTLPTTNTSFSTVVATRKSVLTPAWQTVDMDFTECQDGYDSSGAMWKYVDNQVTAGTSASNASLERQQACGTLLVGTSGFPGNTAANFAYGYFRISGVLELKDLILTSTI